MDQQQQESNAPLIDEQQSEAIDKLIGENPEQVLAKAPSYAPLDPAVEGEWRQVDVKNKPSGILWTDWTNGTGLITTQSSEETSKLREYITVNKMMDAPAGIAYTTASTVEGIELGEPMSGTLENAMIALNALVGEDNTSDESEQ